VQAELVHTITRDGVRLDGAYRAPLKSATPALPVDAFCLVHGTGGNFYNPSFLDSLARRLRELGHGVLRINTRAHDGISTAVTAAGTRRLGAAYEIMDDCRHDMAAWVGWLRERVGPRLGLTGHSSGAVKLIYALSRERFPEVRCLVAVSPPRLSYAGFCATPQGPEFLANMARAEKYVEVGQPAALMDVQVPLPFVTTAAGYLDKYGPHDRYYYLPLLAGLPCPTLITFGSVEMANHVAFQGATDAVQALVERQRHLALRIIPGADHFYAGVVQDLVIALEQWLQTINVAGGLPAGDRREAGPTH
jgi:dienelactone hydrolase